MIGLIPPLEWSRVIVDPWSLDGTFSFWVVLMGFLVTAACGLVGNYLLLRRMALIGDAISHSILAGLVVAFLIFQYNATWVMFFGALTAGFVTVVLIEMIYQNSRIKPDAAICIVFTVLFALGVALMSSMENHGNIHIDAECVLYGEIAFVPLEPHVEIFGVSLGPPSVVRMGLVFVGIIGMVLLFYKELLITAFDNGLARALGMRTGLWHYGLMGALTLVVVSAFEAVGAILAVAMLIVPPMFAAQISDRLSVRLLLILFHALVAALVGYHLSIWLHCSTAGAMVVASAILFLIAWCWTQTQSVRAKFVNEKFTRANIN